MEKRENKTKKLVKSAILCALIFIFTYISVPTPLVGNVNFGDCMIIVSALLLTGPWAMGTAAIGAMLCDIISGYAIYAPATFIIKGVMAGIVQLFLRRKTNTRIGFTYVIGALVAEMFMVAGYFVYEALVLGYGLGASANILFNCIQAAINIALAFFAYKIISKLGIFKK